MRKQQMQQMNTSKTECPKCGDQNADQLLDLSTKTVGIWCHACDFRKDELLLPATFDLPNNMQISIDFIWRKTGETTLHVWYGEQWDGDCAGGTDITNPSLGQFLLKHADDLTF